MQANGAMMAAPLVIILVLIPAVLLSIVAAILPVIAFWKICEKAGFPGALGLLMMVPIANFILPLYVAFAKWPIHEQMQKETTNI